MEFNYTIIVATDQNGGFAKDGKIPWDYHEDFIWFKQKTGGHHCIMGRHTFEDIQRLSKSDIILPGRTPWVVSSELMPADVPVNVGLLRAPLEIEQFISPHRDIMVIGGEQIYNEMINHVGKIYLTKVKGDYDCDRFFPMDYVEDNFKLQNADNSRHPDLTFCTYIRV